MNTARQSGNTDGSSGTAQTYYYDRHFGIDAIKLLPGEYVATQRRCVLVTVLGSCIAVCLRDRDANIGGMNHFMLPDCLDEERGLITKAARYGSYAMELLINHVLAMGARRALLEAKVFGGANVLNAFGNSSVGRRNAEFCLRYLRAENIPVLAQDLLSIWPRKVYFFSGTGKVLVKRLGSLKNNTVLEREADYRRRLRETDMQHDIDLFS